MLDYTDGRTILRAVVNHEEQYLVSRELAAGWDEAGKSETKEERLPWIATVWTDVRPKSLRLAMEQSTGKTL